MDGLFAALVAIYLIGFGACFTFFVTFNGFMGSRREPLFGLLIGSAVWPLLFIGLLFVVPPDWVRSR